MIVKFLAPVIDAMPGRVRIEALDVVVGDKVEIGSRLLEFTSGLDFVGMHGCPPVTTFRMTSSEHGWVRKIEAKPGELVMSGNVMVILSTDPDEPLEGGEERLARHALAAVFKPEAW